MEKIGFFEEKPGQKSSVRLQMFLTMLFAFLVLGYQVYVTKEHTFQFDDALLLLSAAFAPKVIQKFAEMKGGNK